MNFLEHAAKAKVLAPAGIPVPRGILCDSSEDKPSEEELFGPHWKTIGYEEAGR